MWFTPFLFNSTCRGSWVPPTDVVERGDHYEIMMDLPNVQKKDLKVDVKGEGICIAGSRTRDMVQDDQTVFILAERGFGRFERCFEVPHAFDQNTVAATFRDQQLRVELRKLSSVPGGKSSTSVDVN